MSEPGPRSGESSRFASPPAAPSLAGKVGKERTGDFAFAVFPSGTIPFAMSKTAENETVQSVTDSTDATNGKTRLTIAHYERMLETPHNPETEKKKERWLRYAAAATTVLEQAETYKRLAKRYFECGQKLQSESDKFAPPEDY